MDKSKLEQCPFFMRYDQPTKKIIMNDLDYYIVDGRVNLGRLYKRNRPPLQNIIPMGAQYSKKVFLGGLPTDMDEEKLILMFRQFGPVSVDWPHKSEPNCSKTRNGFAFLKYENNISVQLLLNSCMVYDGGKLFFVVTSASRQKMVEIRPWMLNESDYCLDTAASFNPRLVIFVGGLSRSVTAAELANLANNHFGNVSYAGIDVDPEFQYPRGYGRVAFNTHVSYMTAISTKFIRIGVEIKPYLLDMQMCDNCDSVYCRGKCAESFCADVICLKYFCEYCWIKAHLGLKHHKPIIKRTIDYSKLENLGQIMV